MQFVAGSSDFLSGVLWPGLREMEKVGQVERNLEQRVRAISEDW